jgi:integration host factor subunit beta
MTKSDLIRWVSVKTEISYPEAENAVNAFVDTVKAALKKNGRVELRGFGSFSVREYDGYMGRNPRTGETVNVAPKKLPFFKVGKEMREAVNS